MGELGVSPFCPTPRSCIDLICESAHGNGDGDGLRGQRKSACFPNTDQMQRPPFRQPMSAMLSSTSSRVTPPGPIVKDMPDELVATCIMIGYPSRQDIRAVILVVFAQFSNPPCASRTAVSNLSILILFDCIPVMLSPEMIQAVSASDCIGWEHGDSRNFFQKRFARKVRDDRSSSRRS
jgi:hypothetical protein